MENNRRIPINVSVNPSEYSGRSIRLGNSDIKEKMNQRMREFEEESRKWRDQFLLSNAPVTSTIGPGGIGNMQSSSSSTSSSLLDHSRPRMFVNFPEFPELSSSFASPLGVSRLGSSSVVPTAAGSGFFPTPIPFAAQNTHKSFIEEDDHGHKKYKMIFEVGDFKPNEIQVRTEGRQLIVKGDRELVAGSATESKQFNKEITLPDFIEPTSVTSFLSEGNLTIEAPVLLDRLGYSGNNAVTNTTSSSSSTLRNSPFRDNSSPSRIGGSSLLNSSRNYRNSREDLLNLNAASSSSTNTSSTIGGASTQQSHNSFNTPFFNDIPQVSMVSNANAPPAIYKFNMSEFRPEDIAITVTDTTLKIHAVREESDIRGNGKTYREFKREIGLPQGADVKRLKNSLQSDGTLSIEIPVQDNFNLRPPLSPTGLNKQFGNFSLNENSTFNTNASNNVGSSTGGILLNNATTGLVDQSNNGKELKLTFDLTGYKPEDVSIKVIDNNTLKVHAVHIDNTRGNQIHREYTRQYILPEWVQPELLRARMSDNGTLTVEVPLPQVQPSKFERLINIQNMNR